MWDSFLVAHPDPVKSLVGTGNNKVHCERLFDAVCICLSPILDALLVTAERTTTSWVVKLGDSIRTVV